MASLDNSVYDDGLSTLQDGNQVHICSQEPTTFTEAATTYTLGYKEGFTVSVPSDRSGGGREVLVSGITEGDVTADGTANYWALVDTVNSVLLATEALTAPQAVVNGNKLNLSNFTIGIPGPA